MRYIVLQLQQNKSFGRYLSLFIAFLATLGVNLATPNNASWQHWAGVTATMVVNNSGRFINLKNPPLP